jgi:hypothetical protein
MYEVQVRLDVCKQEHVSQPAGIRECNAQNNGINQIGVYLGMPPNG